MSNYVTNYVFCNEKLYDDFLNTDFHHRRFQEGMYDPIGCILDNSRRRVIFDTRGMDYKNGSIERIISEFHDVVWNCVEENEIEEGQFYWDGEKVALDVRPLQESDQDCFFTIKYYDPDYKTFKSIMGFPGKIVEENFVTNTKREFYLSERDSYRIKSYMNSLRVRILNDSDYGEYPVEVKDNIIDQYWFWSPDKIIEYAGICPCDAGLADQKEYDKGKYTKREVQDYLKTFFLENGIDIKLAYKEIKEFVC